MDWLIYSCSSWALTNLLKNTFLGQDGFCIWYKGLEEGWFERKSNPYRTTSLEIDMTKLSLILDKGIPGEGLLSHIIASKYCDHNPLNRLEGTRCSLRETDSHCEKGMVYVRKRK